MRAPNYFIQNVFVCFFTVFFCLGVLQHVTGYWLLLAVPCVWVLAGIFGYFAGRGFNS